MALPRPGRGPASGDTAPDGVDLLARFSAAGDAVELIRFEVREALRLPRCAAPRRAAAGKRESSWSASAR